MIFAIDPGNEKSAFVIFNPAKQEVVHHATIPNDELYISIPLYKDHEFVIEMVACYGMPVGATVFETCVQIGRFSQIISDLRADLTRVYRKDVKMHFCGTMRAKDANVRQSLIDRFGEPGTKKNPGKLYGIKKDEWSALAVAVFHVDNLRKR